MKRICIFLTAVLVAILSFAQSAYSAIDEKEWQKEQQSFILAYSSVSATVRADAIKKLAEVDHPGKVKIFAGTILPKEIKENELALVDLALRDLSAITDPAAIEEIITATNKAKPPEKLILMRAAGKINTPETTKILIDILKTSDRDTLVKMTAIDALADAQPPEAFDLVLSALTHRAWEVRVSAVEYLGKVTDEENKKKALATLRTRLGQESGRLRNDIADAINKLGQTEIDKKSASTATFFDIPLEGDIIFVLDKSKSMEGKNAQGISRWHKLVEELKAAIEAMSKVKNAKFNIITYNDKIFKFDKTLVPAAENKDRALQWIDTQKPAGYTDIYGALEEAMADQTNADKGPKVVITGLASGVSNAYTICMMTDGAPSAGKYLSGEDILAALRILNLTRKIRINTIALDMGVAEAMAKAPMGMAMGGAAMFAADNALMEAIAREQNGTFKAY